MTPSRVLPNELFRSTRSISSLPPRRHSAVSRWAVRCALAVAVGVLWAQHFVSTPRPAAGVAVPLPANHPAAAWAAMPADTGNPLKPTVMQMSQQDAALPATPAPSGVADADPAARVKISAQGASIRIEAHTASRWQAALQLAALTRTTVLEQPLALKDTRPLTVQWHGEDPAAAWAVLLDGEINYALRCGREGCLLWLLPATKPAAPLSASAGQVPLRMVAASAAATGSPTLAPARVLPTVPSLNMPPQTDPLGLFPSD